MYNPYSSPVRTNDPYGLFDNIDKLDTIHQKTLKLITEREEERSRFLASQTFKTLPAAEKSAVQQTIQTEQKVERNVVSSILNSINNVAQPVLNSVSQTATNIAQPILNAAVNVVSQINSDVLRTTTNPLTYSVITQPTAPITQIAPTKIQTRVQIVPPSIVSGPIVTPGQTIHISSTLPAQTVPSTIKTVPSIITRASQYLQSLLPRFGTQATTQSSVSPRPPILFYEKGQPYYEFTNFYYDPNNLIAIDGQDWFTVEHYFQAQKFIETPRLVQGIRNIISARQVVDIIGRNPKYQSYIRKDWDEVKDGIMYKGVYAKFSQNEELRNLLLSTRTRKLVEHTANDKYWADGGDGGNGIKGQNKLGQILMRVREELSLRTSISSIIGIPAPSSVSISSNPPASHLSMEASLNSPIGSESSVSSIDSASFQSAREGSVDLKYIDPKHFNIGTLESISQKLNTYDMVTLNEFRNMKQDLETLLVNSSYSDNLKTKLKEILLSLDILFQIFESTPNARTQSQIQLKLVELKKIIQEMKAINPNSGGGGRSYNSKDKPLQLQKNNNKIKITKQYTLNKNHKINGRRKTG